MPHEEEKSNHGPPRVQHSLVQALRGVPSLSTLDDTEVLTIVGESSNLFWAAGGTVVEHGSAADGLYIVLSGEVLVRAPDGTEVNVLGPGEFFGEFSLLLDAPRRHDVVAVEDTELMVVSKERIERLLEEHVEFGREVRARLEARLVENARSGEQEAP
jgi:CRP-like cAMP-binding protein